MCCSIGYPYADYITASSNCQQNFLSYLHFSSFFFALNLITQSTNIQPISRLVVVRNSESNTTTRSVARSNKATTKLLNTGPRCKTKWFRSIISLQKTAYQFP